MSFMQRFIGVFKLDKAVFNDIERDQGALGQGFIVVTITAILGFIGNLISFFLTDGATFGPIIFNLIWVYVGWVLWSLVVFIVGTMLFKGDADFPEMLRVIGFAYAPQVLMIIPCIGLPIGAIWTLIAGFVAVREGLDISGWKAFATVVIGFIVYLIGALLIGGTLGAGSALLSGLGG